MRITKQIVPLSIMDVKGYNTFPLCNRIPNPIWLRRPYHCHSFRDLINISPLPFCWELIKFGNDSVSLFRKHATRLVNVVLFFRGTTNRKCVTHNNKRSTNEYYNILVLLFKNASLTQIIIYVSPSKFEVCSEMAR